MSKAFQNYEQARAAARRLGELTNTEWTQRVWNNFGWRIEVRSPCGRIAVRPDESDYFTATIGEPFDMNGRWVGQAITPQEAVHAARERARVDYSAMQKLLGDLLPEAADLALLELAERVGRCERMLSRFTDDGK